MKRTAFVTIRFDAEGPTEEAILNELASKPICVERIADVSWVHQKITDIRFARPSKSWKLQDLEATIHLPPGY